MGDVGNHFHCFSGNTPLYFSLQTEFLCSMGGKMTRYVNVGPQMDLFF